MGFRPLGFRKTYVWFGSSSVRLTNERWLNFGYCFISWLALVLEVKKLVVIAVLPHTKKDKGVGMWVFRCDELVCEIPWVL